jgi:hypothetical protein
LSLENLSDESCNSSGTENCLLAPKPSALRIVHSNYLINCFVTNSRTRQVSIVLSALILAAVRHACLLSQKIFDEGAWVRRIFSGSCLIVLLTIF